VSLWLFLPSIRPSLFALYFVGSSFFLWGGGLPGKEARGSTDAEVQLPTPDVASKRGLRRRGKYFDWKGSGWFHIIRDAFEGKDKTVREILVELRGMFKWGEEQVLRPNTRSLPSVMGSPFDMLSDGTVRGWFELKEDKFGVERWALKEKVEAAAKLAPRRGFDITQKPLPVLDKSRHRGQSFAVRLEYEPSITVCNTTLLVGVLSLLVSYCSCSLVFSHAGIPPFPKSSLPNSSNSGGVVWPSTPTS
jgi:hypothetical protein